MVLDEDKKNTVHWQGPVRGPCPVDVDVADADGADDGVADLTGMAEK